MTSAANILLGSYSKPLPDGAVSISAPTKHHLSSCLGMAFTHSITIYVNAHELSTHYDPLALASLVSNLAPDGTLSINIPVTNEDFVDWDIVTKSFLLSGLKAESEQRDGSGGRIYTARKAAVEGASKINLKGKITLSLDEDDDNLIDEDDLLTGATGGLLAPPSMEARSKSADDCGGRKPCDNCTCGRAEQGVQEEKKEQQKSSSCGNCAKGDAFRCAGCPYLGMPAFKEGEEHLILNLKDDV